ncbi:hypothetical protein ZOSMA_62G00300 [Zostera marina]|uniref:Uncharacterized protein n=1 Tax=Zostera marina TaxID=29655 RepID=A0A0K9NVH0_ZOSMR|nr:hypothetical protein ZOSMA_62G00300 [Zostera marina]
MMSVASAVFPHFHCAQWKMVSYCHSFFSADTLTDVPPALSHYFRVLHLPCLFHLPLFARRIYPSPFFSASAWCGQSRMEPCSLLSLPEFNIWRVLPSFERKSFPFSSIVIIYFRNNLLIYFCLVRVLYIPLHAMYVVSCETSSRLQTLENEKFSLANQVSHLLSFGPVSNST